MHARHAVGAAAVAAVFAVDARQAAGLHGRHPHLRSSRIAFQDHRAGGQSAQSGQGAGGMESPGESAASV